MTLAEKIAETAARYIDAQGDWHEEGREFVRLRDLVREWRDLQGAGRKRADPHETGTGGKKCGESPTGDAERDRLLVDSAKEQP